MLTTASLPAQIAAFSFNGAAGNEAAFSPDSQPEYAIVGAMNRGPGLNPSSSAGTFSASAWPTAERDQTDYFTFTITPYDGMSLALTQLVLDERRSSTGVRDWCVRSSVDFFSQNLSVFAVPDDSLTRVDQITLLGSEFAHVTGTVEFRIYGYHSETGAGTWRIDNVGLYGTATPVPEPAAGSLAAGTVLLAAFATRRMRKNGYRAIR
jgi:hypothetical protein